MIDPRDKLENLRHDGQILQCTPDYNSMKLALIFDTCHRDRNTPHVDTVASQLFSQRVLATRTG